MATLLGTRSIYFSCPFSAALTLSFFKTVVATHWLFFELSALIVSNQSDLWPPTPLHCGECLDFSSLLFKTLIRCNSIVQGCSTLLPGGGSDSSMCAARCCRSSASLSWPAPHDTEHSQHFMWTPWQIVDICFINADYSIIISLFVHLFWLIM